MTSISSALTSSQYQYQSLLSVPSVSDSSDSSSTSSSTAKKASSTSSSSSDDTSGSDDQSLIAAAEKLLSQMMTMLLNSQSSNSGSSSNVSTSNGSTSGSVTTTSSSTDQSDSQTDPISAMDTDGDGSISEAEFVAARPSDVNEKQATSLFKSFDTANTGSLTEDQLSQDMQASAPPPPPQGMQPSDSDLSDMFTSMDADGDGSVSEAEFVAARPSGTSADDATSLFDSLDATQSGSITESQFASGMKAQTSTAQPPQFPDFSSLFASGTTDDTTEELLSL